MLVENLLTLRNKLNTFFCVRLQNLGYNTSYHLNNGKWKMSALACNWGLSPYDWFKVGKIRCSYRNTEKHDLLEVISIPKSILHLIFYWIRCQYSNLDVPEQHKYVMKNSLTPRMLLWEFWWITERREERATSAGDQGLSRLASAITSTRCILKICW